MAKIYPGILNCNEYYTNHYFSSIFDGDASQAISVWKDAARASESFKTPWSCLKENAKSYYTVHEKFTRVRSSLQVMPLIRDMADKYLNSLGYTKSTSIIEDVNGIRVPIYLEVKKNNGNPLLWVLLSLNKSDDDSILDGNIFDGSFDEDASATFINEEFDTEELVTKALFSNDLPPRWIIIIGMNGIALIDRNKWNEKRYLHFDLKDILTRRDDSTLQAMSVLLHKESLCPDDGNSLLDGLDENSNKHAAEVSKDLKYALRECIELLGNEVLYDLKNNKNRDLDLNPVDPAELTIQCLRFMYRMLFVLFIESRNELGYAPMKDLAYVTGYSLESLRDIVDEINEEVEEVGNGYYLGESILKLFSNIYYGYPRVADELLAAEKMESIHDAFVIEPLKAHIFDPDLTKMISEAKLRNSVMIKIIRLMSISRDSGHGKGRISYANLGINQLGSVYEALLSYRGFIAQHTLYEVKRAGDSFDELDVGYFIPESELGNYKDDERVRYEHGVDAGKPRRYEKGTFIYRLAGREREKSASYYTPEVLTKCLVKYALKELLVDKTADEILSLTICEPAMGSAAFLNEAINQLAEAYINKKQEELGEFIPYEDRYQEVQKVKMYIADKNIYGVDLNSTAVELAEVSLWLNTICKGGHIPWFGTQIVNGNSLIGARKQVYTKSQLMTDNANLKWFNKAPSRVMPGTVRKDKSEIYHFLTGDPGMCSYNDSVIKSLAKEQIDYMKKWNKEFIKEYNQDDIESLLRLSSIIDNLWLKQIELRKEVEKQTSDKFSVYGHDDESNDSHTTIRQKDLIYKKLYKSEEMENAGPYARLKFAMDYWCSLWFWPIDKAELLPSRSEFIYDMSLILEGGIMAVKSSGYQGKYNKFGQYQYSLFDYDELSGIAGEIQKKYDDLGKVNLDELCEKEERFALVRKIAKENHFMHWELEFADLFEERHGFDLMLGNPPWIKLEWVEEDVLSDFNPIIAIRKMSANDMDEYRNKILISENVKKLYFDEYSSIAGEQLFLGKVQNYPDLSGAVNLYKCFLPQSLHFVNEKGFFSYVHPDGIFDDPKGDRLRKIIYTKIRTHFQFSNELKLFYDVDHHTVFSLNVYSNENVIKKLIDFQAIYNLFSPNTIDECYDNKNLIELTGIKNDKGEWNVRGAKNRIVHINQEKLESYAKIFDGSNDYSKARLPIVYSEELSDVLFKFAECKMVINDLKDNVFGSEMWNETGAQKNGTIVRKTHFPEKKYDVIFSGPNFSICNPCFKTARRICKLNSDYDVVDLNNIGYEYSQRFNYLPQCNENEYFNRAPITSWRQNVLDNYRLLIRNMFNQTGERTLISAICPPNSGHIHAVYELCFADYNNLVVCCGLMASLPFDFYIRATGKGSGGIGVFGMLPFFNKKNPLISRLKLNTALLNCFTKQYEKLWINIYDSTWEKELWSKKDGKLSDLFFKEINKTLYKSSLAKNDYIRRQLLIEIDVIVSMLLNLTLDELISIYQTQFFVLKAYDNDTWYDAKGRIVFTNNRGLIGVGFDRSEFEQIKNAPAGQVFTRTIMDDTMPGGPVERTIEYVAPFDKCDRIEDYKIAWKFFEEKYGRGDN